MGDGLFKNLGRADVDFGNNDHDGHIEGECDAKMLSDLISSRSSERT